MFQQTSRWADTSPTTMRYPCSMHCAPKGDIVIKYRNKSTRWREDKQRACFARPIDSSNQQKALESLDCDSTSVTYLSSAHLQHHLFHHSIAQLRKLCYFSISCLPQLRAQRCAKARANNSEHYRRSNAPPPHNIQHHRCLIDERQQRSLQFTDRRTQIHPFAGDHQRREQNSTSLSPQQFALSNSPNKFAGPTTQRVPLLQTGFGLLHIKQISYQLRSAALMARWYSTGAGPT